MSGAVRVPSVGLDDQVKVGVAEVALHSVDVVVDVRAREAAVAVELVEEILEE